MVGGGFGDSLVVGGSGLHFLVWIQLVVMCLLIFLLYCFSLNALDIGDGGDLKVVESEESAAECLTSAAPEIGGWRSGNLSREGGGGGGVRFLQNSLKVGGSSSTRGEISTNGTSRRVISSQERVERDASAVTETTNKSISENDYHPCFIFKFAREAFLKCLGWDCISKDPTRK